MRVIALLLFCFANFALAQTPTPSTTPNSPPQVFVDGDPDFLNNGAFLYCSSADDGQVRPLTFAWSKVSGPGNVVWGAQQKPMTHVHFSVKGLYVLQCTVSDGKYTVSDKITILADQQADIACRP